MPVRSGGVGVEHPQGLAVRVAGVLRVKAHLPGGGLVEVESLGQLLERLQLGGGKLVGECDVELLVLVRFNFGA